MLPNKFYSLPLLSVTLAQNGDELVLREPTIESVNRPEGGFVHSSHDNDKFFMEWRIM